MDYVIKPLISSDEPILWEMLYQALHTSEGAPPRDTIKRPEFARYVQGWGRAGDTGFIMHDATNRELLGAVWIRLFPDDSSATPQLAFAVKPGLRRRGIGAALLTHLVKANPQYSTISIGAPASNPAVRLYERFGFKIVQEGAEGVKLQREA